MANEWNRATWTYSPVGLSHTPQRIVNAIYSFLSQSGWQRASWSAGAGSTDQHLVRTNTGAGTIWNFNGDGPDQKCGIRIYLNSGANRVELSCFLENIAGTASQNETHTRDTIYVTYDATQDNAIQFIGGEDGFYGEMGTGSNYNNVAHWAIPTMQADSTMSFTRDAERQWTTQGLCLDLFGHLKFTNDWTTRFVEPDGANRNHTSFLYPYAVRGTTRITSNTPTDDIKVGIGSRDNILTPIYSTGGYNQAAGYMHTFGLLWGTLDDRYRISPMYALPYGADFWDAVRSDSNAATIFAAGNMNVQIGDPRAIRKMPKFACMSSLVLPWNTVTDAVTSTIYRAAQVADGGRNSIIGVQWPGSTVSIAATP